MSASLDSSKELIRAELKSRIKECLELRDWARMEHWASQWVQVEPRSPQGFKWLARSALALGRLQKAAYAFGRVLDFDPSFEEAHKFFANHPSIARNGSRDLSKDIEVPAGPTPNQDEKLLQSVAPAARIQLATKSLELAEICETQKIYIKASSYFRDSFAWSPSHAAALGVARCLYAGGNPLEAINFLKQKVQEQRTWILGRLFLADIFRKQGQVQEAQRYIQEALRIDPYNPQALAALRDLALI